MTRQDLRRGAEALKHQAELVRADLELDRILDPHGQVHLVGSAALGLMVWPDLDLTVVCDHLDHRSLSLAAAEVGSHALVRQITVRNDTGHWNAEPATYPDGVYWGVDYRVGGPKGRRWNIDIWFVDDGARQPDLAHVRQVGDRLNDETRDAILAIKAELAGTPEYGTTVRSYDIYQAVLDGGVRTIDQFRAHHRART